jgi:hypothetical protein
LVSFINRVVAFDVNETFAVGRGAELRKQLVITIDFSLPVQLKVLRPPDFHRLSRFNVPKKKLAIRNALNSVLWWLNPASENREVFARQSAGRGKQNEAFHSLAEQVIRQVWITSRFGMLSKRPTPRMRGFSSSGAFYSSQPGL